MSSMAFKKSVKAKSDSIGAREMSISRFAVTYLLLMGAFFLLIVLKPVRDMVDINGLYTQGVVIATAKISKAIGIPCTYQGSLIHLPAITLDVRFGCNGLEAVMIYAVAVVAFPSSWKKKCIGIMAGFVILQVLNVLRIVVLAYTGVHFKSIFEYVHIYVAQGIMIAISLCIFFLYLRYAKSQTAATS